MATTQEAIDKANTLLDKYKLQVIEATTKHSLARRMLAWQLCHLRRSKHDLAKRVAHGFDLVAWQAYVWQSELNASTARLLLENRGYKSVNRKDK
jgi:predicted nucleic acid-binding protein